jgi:diguanylate cyclase (GGDEF)-like protein
MLLSAPHVSASHANDMRRETPAVAPYLQLAFTLLLVALLAWGGVALSGAAGDGAVPVWPANGLVLGLLLTSRPREGWLYLLWGLSAYAASAALCGQPPALGLRLVAVNGTELLLAQALLQEREVNLSAPAALWRFILAAGLLAPAAATLLNMLLQLLVSKDVSPPLIASFFLAHGLGMVAVAPLVLAARRGALHVVQRAGALPCAAGFALLAAAILLVMWQALSPLLFLLLPPLLAVVVLSGLEGGALGLCLIMASAACFARLGMGVSLLPLQAFTAAAAGLVLAAAAGLAALDNARAALQAARRELENRATSDGLTGLANQRRRDEFLAHEFRRASRQDGALSVLLIDLDLFTIFNNRYGNEKGDSCLREVAALLRNYSRRPGDLACRHEGGAFTLILEAGAEAAGYVAEGLRAGIAQLALPHAANGAHRGIVTASIGAATLLPGASHASPEALLQDAAELLYEAKRGGRNRVVSRADWPDNPAPPRTAREEERVALVETILPRLQACPSEALQTLTAQAAALMGTPMAAISLVARDRQVFATRCGLEIEGTGRDASFCAHAMGGELPLLVPDTARDARFSHNRLVTGAPHIGFYAGAPIVSMFGNLPLGVLCVMEDAPRAAPGEAMLAELARLAAKAGALIDRKFSALAAE